MKNKFWIVVIGVAVAGVLYAEHTYEKVASAHDIMELVQEPNMDALAAMMKAGGPHSDRDWRHAKAHASVLVESSQLLLMAGRIKDDVWEKGAKAVISAGKASMQAAEAKDLNAWKAANAGIGKGCRGCHKVHKPKKKKKQASAAVERSSRINTPCDSPPRIQTLPAQPLVAFHHPPAVTLKPQTW